MTTYIGAATSRIDGHAKVTGAAKYAGEFKETGLAQFETLRTVLLAAHPPKKDDDAVDMRVGNPLPPGN